jgi:hypothetical protein
MAEEPEKRDTMRYHHCRHTTTSPGDGLHERLSPRRRGAFPRGAILIAALGIAAACGGQGNRGGGDGLSEEGNPAGCDAAAARKVVETFGERLKNVSLLAPDSIVATEIRANYGGLVTEHLLDGWLFRLDTAPGREVSSPWPERIQVDTVRNAGAGTCLVEGKIVYLTSMEVTHGGAAALRPVTMQVQQQDDDGWKINSYQVTTPAGVAGVAPDTTSPGTTSPGALPGAATSDSTSPAAAADVVRRYYEAINAGEFRRAYELWGDSGKASGQTYQEFAAGFAQTASVEVEVGTPGRVEGAAGSRFVEVPVVIRAVLKNGAHQRFQGSYTLQRVVVEGASPAERRWHLFSAKISQ